MSLKRIAPNSLSSYVLTGFSIDPANGLSIVKAPIKLKVNPPLRLSFDLPKLIKLGEVVTIPCSVFNRLTNGVEAEVSVENRHNEFESVDLSGHNEIEGRKHTIISSNTTNNVCFSIRPQILGTISIKISVNASNASDCVTKTFNVESEGVTEYANKTVFVDLINKNGFDTVEVPIGLPKNALPDTSSVDFVCAGDLMGTAISNIGKLAKLPCCSGDQNILDLATSTIVLNYLKNIDQLTDQLRCKPKEIMEFAYQRIRSYKREDGSFNQFGKCDGFGCTWLTAAVAKYVHQFQYHLTTDKYDVEEALRWLGATQNSDGSFTENSFVLAKEMKSESANNVALTAYVLMAFLENKVVIFIISKRIWFPSWKF